jgi:hypothetical protein
MDSDLQALNAPERRYYQWYSRSSYLVFAKEFHLYGS